MARTKKEKEVAYYGELYRFGYDLKALGHTEEECRQVLMKTYRKWYRNWNDGCRPTKEELRRANEDINIDKMVFGEEYNL